MERGWEQSQLSAGERRRDGVGREREEAVRWGVMRREGACSIQRRSKGRGGWGGRERGKDKGRRVGVGRREWAVRTKIMNRFHHLWSSTSEAAVITAGLESNDHPTESVCAAWCSPPTHSDPSPLLALPSKSKAKTQETFHGRRREIRKQLPKLESRKASERDDENFEVWIRGSGLRARFRDSPRKP